MTLTQKFNTRVGYNEYGIDASECEKIADDYAIELLQFQIGLLTKYIDGKFYFEYDAKWLTSKQLLEIFKKQKGL